MPRLRVIVLDQPSDDSSAYRFALWADVPAARQTFYANPKATSGWTGATAADITALQNGSVVEYVSTQKIPTGATLAQVEGWLQTAWTDFQAKITNYNPWIHYGSTWDGTTWTVVTGA